MLLTACGNLNLVLAISFSNTNDMVLQRCVLKQPGDLNSEAVTAGLRLLSVRRESGVYLN
jgi:hypothetical protein